MTELDVRLFMLLHEALSKSLWLVPFVALTVIGSGWGALLVVPLFASPRTRSFARSLAIVLATTTVLVFALKKIVARVRPCNCVAGIRSLVFDAPSDFSFPSGHAAASFAFAVFTAIVLVRTAPIETRARALRYAFAAALVLLASGISLSRVALGVHFPGDITAGAILGTTIAAVGARVHLTPRVTSR